jgi:hypothetical protein
MEVPRVDSLHGLRTRSWPHRAGPFRALGHVFDVYLPDEAFAVPVEAGFRWMATETEAETSYHIVPLETGDVELFGLFSDGERTAHPLPRDRILGHLFWQVNHQAVESTKGRLLVHAGAVASPAGAVVMPGRMGAGKSTLTAALVQSGLAYLSDELAVIDPDTRRVEPYPRAIALDASARRLLGLDDRELAGKAGGVSKWHLDPVLLGGRLATGPADVALVVAPARAEHTAVELEPLDPAEAVVLLGEQSFNLRDLPEQGLTALAAICEAAPCYRLRSNHVTAGRDAVLELMESLG